MTDDNQIEKAIERALEALAKDDLKWVRESALRERAYLLGVAAAMGLLDSSKAGERLAILLVARTLNPRAADMPYQSTELWAATEALCSELAILRQEVYRAAYSEALAGLRGVIERVHTTSDHLRRKVEQLDRQWEQETSQVKDALERTIKHVNAMTATKTLERKKVHGLLSELGELEGELRDRSARMSQFEMEPARF